MKKLELQKIMNIFNIESTPVVIEDVLTAEDKAMTQEILDNITAIEEAMAQNELEVLLDTVAYDEKPQGSAIAGIVNRLPQNKVTVTLNDLVDAVVNGQSWKASVLSDTSNASFVSSSLVALDIDNKESYTSIDEFIAMDSKYQPCFIYETFSSTKEHERFRVVYAFDNVIDDYSTMVALYNEVKAQYPTVDIDESVDPGKILFGGKKLRLFNNCTNEVPELTVVPLEVLKAERKAISSKVITESIEIDEMDVFFNLSEVADKYSDIHEIDINESYEWINKNVKMTDALGIEEGARFRCILPDHEDNNPSARIVTYGDEQAYMCSCEASGYRLITLLSKLLDMSEVRVKTIILDALHISYGSAYQKATERYIADLRRNIDRIMTQDLKDYLHKRKLYQTYKLIVDFADNHIPYNSFANDNRVVFFMGQRVLQDEMKQNYISGNADRKLLSLCELGLLRKLTDSELKDNVLSNADRSKKALKTKLSKNTGADITELNRVDFYELVDLSPSVVKKAMNIVNTMKDCAVRQRHNNMDRRINAFGEEEVTQHINVQSTIDTKKRNNIQTKLETVINDLLESNKYFSEMDLATAYRNTDKKHINKAKAQQIVLDYVPYFINAGLIKRIRVNKDTRKQYDISNKYNSNTYVYVSKNN